MFRQEETYLGDWQEKTLAAMQKRRFTQQIAKLPPLGAQRMQNLSVAAFERMLEQCWQDVERKPMRAQQETAVTRAVLDSVNRQADCLSVDEHELVERALILGGCAPIEDAVELAAAHALSLRCWASVGLVSGKPYVELERCVAPAIAKAFAREEHGAIRARFKAFHGYMTSLLYRAGAMDDRQPQHMILRDVLGSDEGDEAARQLARRYLWASYDCVDYSEGVLLVHRALAEPLHMLADGRRRSGLLLPMAGEMGVSLDILPEEIPLQRALECAIGDALKNPGHAQEVAQTIRFLCKQGAPISAMEDVLQSSLIVYITDAMRRALTDMYTMMPKWIECSEGTALQ